MRPIGLLGGTFDPVHHGHLRLAVELLQSLALDSVRFIPLNQPSHREDPVASPALRLTLLQAAVAGEPGLRVDDIEIQRGGVSYTVDTLQMLRQRYQDAPLCLFLGQDAFAGLADWHRWEEILELCHIVVASRSSNLGPNSPVPTGRDIGELLKSRQISSPGPLAEQTAGYILLQPVPMLDISSTEIRAAVRAGRSIRYWVSDSVHSLIRQHDLYDGK